MNQFCPVCGETRCARVDAECKTPCYGTTRADRIEATRARMVAEAAAAFDAAYERPRKLAASVTRNNVLLADLADQAAFAQQRESAMARNVYGSAESWLAAHSDLQRGAEIAQGISAIVRERAARAAMIRAGGEDPDGPPTPLPKPPERAVASPAHDFLAALYRPYQAPV